MLSQFFISLLYQSFAERYLSEKLVYFSSDKLFSGKLFVIAKNRISIIFEIKLFRFAQHPVSDFDIDLFIGLLYI